MASRLSLARSVAPVGEPIFGELELGSGAHCSGFLKRAPVPGHPALSPGQSDDYAINPHIFQSAPGKGLEQLPAHAHRLLAHVTEVPHGAEVREPPAVMAGRFIPAAAKTDIDVSFIGRAEAWAPDWPRSEVAAAPWAGGPGSRRLREDGRAALR